MNSEAPESKVESKHPDVAVLYRCWKAGFGEMFKPAILHSLNDAADRLNLEAAEVLDYQVGDE